MLGNTKSHVITVLSLDAKRDELGTSNIRCSKYAGELTEKIDKKKGSELFVSKMRGMSRRFLGRYRYRDEFFFSIYLHTRSRLGMQFPSTS